MYRTTPSYLALALWLLALAGGFWLLAAPPALAWTTSRVSVSSGGAGGGAQSDYPAISSDGRYVAFQSQAGNLVSGDTNGGWDIFRHDRLTGATIRVSVTTAGAQVFAPSYDPCITADGRYVVFMGTDGELVGDDTDPWWNDIYVHDCVAGTTELISRSSSGEVGNDNDDQPALTPDGRYLAFVSASTNLVAGDGNNNSDIFVRDLLTGVTSLVSVSSSGAQSNGYSYEPVISANGRYVAFVSEATNLVAGDTNGCVDIFVHDRVTGTTTRASVSSAEAQANNESYWPSLSADGHYLAFHSYASNLVTGDTNAGRDVFVRDTVAGTTSRVSLKSDGSEAASESLKPCLSADGRYVAFESEANLVPADTNLHCDVYVWDRQPATPTLLSLSTAGGQGNDDSGTAVLSPSGLWLAFVSTASNLVSGDGNGAYDVFERDTGLEGPAAPTVSSVAPTGTNCSAQFPVVRVTFSKAMDAASTQAAFAISPAVDGNFSWSGNELRYSIPRALAPLTAYKVTIATTAQSADGANLGTAKSWTFKTNNVPAVASRAPLGTAVAAGSVIRLGFNQAMNRTSVQNAFSVTPARSGGFSWVKNVLTFTPAAPLPAGVQFTVAVAKTAKSSGGLALAAAYSWRFTVAGTPTYPVVTSKAPQGSAVAGSANIRLTFNTAMNKGSVQRAFKLRRQADPASTAGLPGTFTWSDARNVSFNPADNLAAGTPYVVVVSTGATSALLIRMQAAFTYSFTTAAPTPALSVTALPTAAGAQVTATLTSAATVETVVLNVAGREVARLPERVVPAGVTALSWNGRSAQGTRVPSGRYLVRVTARTATGEAVCTTAPLTLPR